MKYSRFIFAVMASATLQFVMMECSSPPALTVTAPSDNNQPTSPSSTTSSPPPPYSPTTSPSPVSPSVGNCYAPPPSPSPSPSPSPPPNQSPSPSSSPSPNPPPPWPACPPLPSPYSPPPQPYSPSPPPYYPSPSPTSPTPSPSPAPSPPYCPTPSPTPSTSPTPPHSPSPPPYAPTPSPSPSPSPNHCPPAPPPPPGPVPPQTQCTGLKAVRYPDSNPNIDQTSEWTVARVTPMPQPYPPGFQTTKNVCSCISYVQMCQGIQWSIDVSSRKSSKTYAYYDATSDVVEYDEKLTQNDPNYAIFTTTINQMTYYKQDGPPTIVDPLPQPVTELHSGTMFAVIAECPAGRFRILQTCDQILAWVMVPTNMLQDASFMDTVNPEIDNMLKEVLGDAKASVLVKITTTLPFDPRKMISTGLPPISPPNTTSPSSSSSSSPSPSQSSSPSPSTSSPSPSSSPPSSSPSPSPGPPGNPPAIVEP